MKIEQEGRFIHVHIEPGEYYASGEAVTISTLLGSCVSACLYDPVNRIIGMNHFLLSNRRYAKDLPLYEAEAGRYGINSMELLINEMLKLGAKKNNLMAKAFGGGSIIKRTSAAGNFFCVGKVNVRFIREFLANENIPLVSEDLGGEKGRVVHFANGDFSVHVRKIDSSKSHRLAERDRLCWLRAIEIQEETIPQFDLWL